MSPITFPASVCSDKYFGILTPLRIAFISGIPDPSASALIHNPTQAATKAKASEYPSQIKKLRGPGDAKAKAPRASNKRSPTKSTIKPRRAVMMPRRVRITHTEGFRMEKPLRQRPQAVSDWGDPLAPTSPESWLMFVARSVITK